MCIRDSSYCFIIRNRRFFLVNDISCIHLFYHIHNCYSLSLIHIYIVSTYKMKRISCKFPKYPYLCIVFFIVLDLRVTKVGARRCSFFDIYRRHSIHRDVYKRQVRSQYHIVLVHAHRVIPF